MNFTALHPKLHLRSLAPQKNIGIARSRKKAVIAAISPSATNSPSLAIHELVVAERPKPMIARCYEHFTIMQVSERGLTRECKLCDYHLAFDRSVSVESVYEGNVNSLSGREGHYVMSAFVGSVIIQISYQDPVLQLEP
jgi:hypothetical protein